MNGIQPKETKKWITKSRASIRGSKPPHRKTLSANGTSSSAKGAPNLIQVVSRAKVDPTQIRMSKEIQEKEIRRSPKNSEEVSHAEASGF
jgi:hypothetical protein